MNDVQTVFFIGRPGCGKGTQAKYLCEKTGWPVFSAGRLFREIAKEESPVGRKVKKESESGMLAPHWFAMYLYLKSLFSLSDGSSVIFDGFNRKVAEAELVTSSLRWLGRPFTIIHLNVSEEAVRRRLTGRSETSGRADDFAVDKRLREFDEHTALALEHFRKEGVLVEIDGEMKPEEIAVAVQKALGIA